MIGPQTYIIRLLAFPSHMALGYEGAVNGEQLGTLMDHLPIEVAICVLALRVVNEHLVGRKWWREWRRHWRLQAIDPRRALLVRRAGFNAEGSLLLRTVGIGSWLERLAG